MVAFIWGLLSVFVTAFGTFCFGYPSLSKRITTYAIEIVLILLVTFIYRYYTQIDMFNKSIEALRAQYMSYKLDGINYDSLMTENAMYGSLSKLTPDQKIKYNNEITLMIHEYGVKRAIHKRIEEFKEDAFQDLLTLSKYFVLILFVLIILYSIAFVSAKFIKKEKV